MRDNEGVHVSAIIGHPPEDRDWTEPDGSYSPVLGEKVRIGALVTVDAGLSRHTTIGDRSWLLKKVHVGHDALIGKDCTIATAAVIGGHCVIGDGAKVGINATVLPFRMVGTGAVVGAGAVVTENVPPGQTWAGNPARPIEPNPVPFTDRVLEVRR